MPAGILTVAYIAASILFKIVSKWHSCVVNDLIYIDQSTSDVLRERDCNVVLHKGHMWLPLGHHPRSCLGPIGGVPPKTVQRR